jgi:hypothetical protein
MRIATLITWLLTASLGGFMLRTWVARGGLRRERARAGGLPPQLIFGHATLAITGLVLWGCFMASGVRGLAWAAIACVMVAVGLGLSTVTLWTPYPTVYPAAREERAPVVPGRSEAEYQVTDEMIARLLADPFPERRQRVIQPNMAVLVPVAHGFLAIATFVLAVTAASMA